MNQQGAASPTAIVQIAFSCMPRILHVMEQPQLHCTGCWLVLAYNAIEQPSARMRVPPWVSASTAHRKAHTFCRSCSEMGLPPGWVLACVLPPLPIMVTSLLPAAPCISLCWLLPWSADATCLLPAAPACLALALALAGVARGARAAAKVLLAATACNQD